MLLEQLAAIELVIHSISASAPTVRFASSRLIPALFARYTMLDVERHRAVVAALVARVAARLMDDEPVAGVVAAPDDEPVLGDSLAADIAEGGEAISAILVAVHSEAHACLRFDLYAPRMISPRAGLSGRASRTTTSPFS